MQHQYQRSAGIAGDRDVELQPQRCPHDACLNRRGHRRFLALPNSPRANLEQNPLRSHPAVVRDAHPLAALKKRTGVIGFPSSGRGKQTFSSFTDGGTVASSISTLRKNVLYGRMFSMEDACF
jgi:hypothetical protein